MQPGKSSLTGGHMAVKASSGHPGLGSVEASHVLWYDSIRRRRARSGMSETLGFMGSLTKDRSEEWIWTSRRRSCQRRCPARKRYL